MAARRLGVVVEHLRRLSAGVRTSTLSDQQLLEHFAAQRSEAAFQALVGRYGPMVLGVCRRVLYQAEDVEDAFQATFLVLARKAGSVGRQGSLRNWLYGVAYRTAARARADAARRRAREAGAPARAPADPLAEMTARELLTVLDAELAQLPAHYRGPLLLCYLEAKTRDEAAAALGWSVATLGRRLRRGRELLRRRLARRGLALPAALVPALLRGEATAAVPTALAASTVRAAAQAAGASARAVALSEGVLRPMLATKWKMALAGFLAVGLLGAGLGLVAQTPGGRPGGEPAGGKAATASARDRAEADRARLRGEWVFDSAESGDGHGGPQDLITNFWRSRVTFRGDELRLSNVRVPTERGFRTVNLRARFVLDPAHRPRHIDVELKDGSAPGVLAGMFKGKGIYEVEGDTLKLCVVGKGAKERPAQFKAPAGSDRYLLVLKRVPGARHKDAGGKKEEKGLTVRLVDTRGNPVVLAKVGTRADFDLFGQGPEWTYWYQMISGEDGIAHSSDAPADVEAASNVWLIARHHGRNLVAIEKLTPYRLLSSPVTLTMRSACRLSGRLRCPGLERRKIGLGRTCVSLFPDGRPCNYRCGSDEQTFHFYAPPGRYTLYATGEKVHSVQKTVTIKPGQRTLTADIEFPLPRRLATLEGRPAPEFSEVADWKNGPPLKLADLRGKCVLVVFWSSSCPPCLEEMPALSELYEKYKERGLAVVGVHVDTSSDPKADTVAKLDRLLAGARKKLWKGKDIPFPVALARHREVRYGADVHQQAPCRMAADYGVTWYPTHVLIDRRGNVVGQLAPQTEAGMALLKKTLRDK